MTSPQLRSVYLDPELTIKKAASRARGDRLSKLFALCEGQSTVSTRKLARLLQELAASDCQDALHFRHLADFLRKVTKTDPAAAAKVD